MKVMGASLVGFFVFYFPTYTALISSFRNYFVYLYLHYFNCNLLYKYIFTSILRIVG